MKAIILAGGEGRRLRPYTTVLPKPLMPLGDRPILEHLICQLKNFNIKEIVLSVGYLAELIEAYFGDGSKYGVNISYLRENKPLGTAGPIRNIESVDEPFLVMNGDILTDLDFDALIAFHKKKGHALTIATYKKEVQIQLGVLDVNADCSVTGYTEKPVLDHTVSMGIYYCNPLVKKYIPEDSRFDLPDLVKKMLADGQTVNAYSHTGYWLDIGRHEDYEHALDHMEKYVEAK